MREQAAVFLDEGHVRPLDDLKLAPDGDRDHDPAAGAHRCVPNPHNCLIHRVLRCIPIARDHFDLYIFALLVLYFQRAAVRGHYLHF